MRFRFSQARSTRLRSSRRRGQVRRRWESGANRGADTDGFVTRDELNDALDKLADSHKEVQKQQTCDLLSALREEIRKVVVETSSALPAANDKTVSTAALPSRPRAPSFTYPYAPVPSVSVPPTASPPASRDADGYERDADGDEYMRNAYGDDMRDAGGDDYRDSAYGDDMRDAESDDYDRTAYGDERDADVYAEERDGDADG